MFRFRQLLFPVLLLFSISCFAQIHRDGIWCFGDSAGLDFTVPALPTTFTSSVRSRGSCCSIADSSGHLLFYAHTANVVLTQTSYNKLGMVWNRKNMLMQNGDSLVGIGWYKEMVAIPDPSNSNKYYLFHTGVTSNAQLYYSVIDLNYNYGLGMVTQKNIVLSNLSGLNVADGLTAIKHGNGRDWWIVFRTWDQYGGGNNNTFYTYLVTPSGISNLFMQNLGIMSWSGFERLQFNNRGDKVVLYNPNGLIELFDFDRCSGLFSNENRISWETFMLSDRYWGAEFSPNGQFLYVTTSGMPYSLYQFDITSATIPLTKTLIDSISYPYSGGGDLKLAPDGKIYEARWYYDGINFPYPYPDTLYNQYNTNLSVINSPNNVGVACDFQPYSFYLGGKRTYCGLPNNPNYDLEALGGSICDTLAIPNTLNPPDWTAKGFSVFPNPCFNKVSVKINTSNLSVVKLVLYDAVGEVVFCKDVFEQDQELDLTEMPPGVYFLSFGKEGQLYKQKIVKL